MFKPDQALRSLILVSWRRADYYVHELVSGLHLGLTGCRPFLTRQASASLRARLVQLEAFARRLLVLFALESPLPAIARRPGQGAPVRRPAPAAPTPHPFLTPPVFRLAEPQPHATLKRAPRRPAAPLRPRLLYLDQPLPPPEPGEYPPRPDELVPATALVRRARALMALFDDPARHIARMARRLARDRDDRQRRFPLADRLPPAARSRKQIPAEREAVHELHRAACLALAGIDSS